MSQVYDHQHEIQVIKSGIWLQVKLFVSRLSISLRLFDKLSLTRGVGCFESQSATIDSLFGVTDVDSC
jgi:hypothetical protein